eukprot:1162071-Pelagomonas_calceolata.AAC.6
MSVYGQHLRSAFELQAYMFWAKIFHLFYYIIFGLGLMPSVVARKLAITHLDLIVEVVLCRLMWQLAVIKDQRHAKSHKLGSTNYLSGGPNITSADSIRGIECEGAALCLCIGKL